MTEAALMARAKPTKKAHESYDDQPDETSPEFALLARNNKIAAQAVLQFEAGLKYKEKRMAIWLEIEKMYNLERQSEVQAGHFDYPLPVLSGFIDTAHSKTDDEPNLEFDPLTTADKPRAKKASAAWRFYSGAEHADWAGEDRAGKKMALMTGRAIFITYCESDPEFNHYFELVDSYDYVAEALGGGNIKSHRCGFQDNLFRSKWEIESAPHYDQSQVKKLIAACSDGSQAKRNALLHRQKINRLVSVGLDPNTFTDYAGDQLYRLTQGFTTFEGVVYWLVMDMSTGLWVRCDPIKEVFASGRHPFVSWASHYDKFNFWSKCSAEDIMPVARGIRDLFNEGMYNIKKRNAGQRAYDPEVFDEPDLLEYRPDGLVPANVIPGKNIAQGVYEFKTEDNTTITVNLINFLDQFAGQKTGITAGAQGQSDKDVKVGVYYGDLQQVADRFGLQNRYYSAMWRDAGDLFSWGMWEHFPAKLMVKVVGESGADWEELKKSDMDPEFSVIIKSSKAELELNEFKKKRMDEALTAIMLDPRYAVFLNPLLAVQEKLRAGGWEEENIRTLMDVSTIGDETSIVNAAQAIEDLLAGKEPRVYRKAGVAFLKKLKDYIDEKEIEEALLGRFLAYFARMAPIVQENMERRGMLGGPTVMQPPGMSPQPIPGGPVPGTPSGTAERSATAAPTPIV